MANHEKEKREWEVLQCQLVAAEMNRLQGTDYEASLSNAEPADVILRSKSVARPTLPVQVVSIPLDFRHRDDKHSVEKIRETLTKSLSARGLRHLLVGLVLSGEAEMHGLTPKALEVLIEIISKEAGNKNLILRYSDIAERSAYLSEFVNDVLISHHETIPNIEIDIPAGSALPPDGRWIEEGIQKKMVKYGGADAVKGLVLVIGVAGFV